MAHLFTAQSMQLAVIGFCINLGQLCEQLSTRVLTTHSNQRKRPNVNLTGRNIGNQKMSNINNNKLLVITIMVTVK